MAQVPESFQESNSDSEVDDGGEEGANESMMSKPPEPEVDDGGEEGANESRMSEPPEDDGSVTVISGGGGGSSSSSSSNSSSVDDGGEPGPNESLQSEPPEPGQSKIKEKAGEVKNTVMEKLSGPSDQEVEKALQEKVKEKGVETVRENLVKDKPYLSSGEEQNRLSLLTNIEGERKSRETKEKIEENIEKIKEGPSKEEVLEKFKEKKKDLLEKSEEEGKIFNITGLNQSIQNLENQEGLYKLNIGGETETVSKEEAISTLEKKKQEEEKKISLSQSYQESILDREAPQPVNLPEKDQEEENNFKKRPTDLEMVTQFGSGTNIPGGISVGDPRSDPEIRKQIIEGRETGEDISTLAFTSAGFEAPFAVIDQYVDKLPGYNVKEERTVAGVIEEKQRKFKEGGALTKGTELLGSPAGLVGTAGIGKTVGAGIKGVQATTGIGTGRVASALGTGAKIGGAGLVGLQLGQGSRNIAQGELTKGGGQILQVTAEAGAFLKGLRSSTRKYGRQVDDTTIVDQENILKQIDGADEDSVLVGSGELTARTRITQRIPFKGGDPGDLKQVDEAVSRGTFKITADRQGAEAQGTITDELLDGGKQTREFESLSMVMAREGDEAVIETTPGQFNRFSLGEDEIVSRNILRTKKEGKLFQSFDDTTRTSISRKQGEKPINEIQSFEVVEDVEQDVASYVRRTDLDAKEIKFSTYTGDREGEVFSDTSNILLKNDRGPGGGSFGSGSQNLKYGSEYPGGFIQESQRQAKFGSQFGARSQEVAKQQIESGSRLQGFTTGGGSGGEGAQAGTENLQAQTQSRDLQPRQDQRQENLQVRRTRAGEQLKKDLGVSSIEGSGTVTRGNRQGLRQEPERKTGEITLNDVKQGIGQEQRTGTGLRQRKQQGIGQANNLTDLSGLKVGQTPGVSQTSITVPQVKLRQRQSFQQSAVSVPLTTTGPGTGTPGLLFNLEAGRRGGSTKGEGNLGLPRNRKGDVKLDILSANRAELLTGSKTFDVEESDVNNFSQSPFSGGVKTEEEEQLKTREYLSDKEQRRFF